MSVVNKLMRQIGHRGAILIGLGLAFIFYGLGLFYTPVFEQHLDLLLPWPWWIWVWVFTGVVTISGAFDGKDKFSYGLAALVSAWWTVRWFHVWLFEPFKGAWPIVAVWATITFIIFVMSSWPDSPTPPPLDEKEDEADNTKLKE
jgi:hypothetical protein